MRREEFTIVFVIWFVKNNQLWLLVILDILNTTEYHQQMEWDEVVNLEWVLAEDADF